MACIISLAGSTELVIYEVQAVVSPAPYAAATTQATFGKMPLCDIAAHTTHGAEHAHHTFAHLQPWQLHLQVHSLHVVPEPRA